MEYKRIVAKNFSSKAELYDELSVVQEKAGKFLLDMLKGVPFGFALDVGSGSGKLASMIGAIGLDISFPMCMLGMSRGVRSVCGDGEELPFSDSSFDLVVSNFSYQWMDIGKAFSEVKRILKNGGFFLFSIPIKNSLKELFDSWNEVFKSHFGCSDRLFSFREREGIISELKGFHIQEIREIEEVIVLNSAREAVKLVTGIGAKNPFRKVSISKGFYRDFVTAYKNRGGGKFPIRYRILLILARK